MIGQVNSWRSGNRDGGAVHKGPPAEVMFALSYEHKVGEIQINGAEGRGEDKAKGESWDCRHMARFAGLQCPVKELLILKTRGIHSMEVPT